MKLIIAGSRTINVSPLFIKDLIKLYNLQPKEIVSGACVYGVDSCGESFALLNDITIKQFPADWKRLGKAAGVLRNKEMAQYADSLLLIWDGESLGSKNMKENILTLNKPIYEVIIKFP